MKRTTNRNFRRLALQSLEERRLMAGDVMARVVNGDLIIQGDAASNAIQISDVPPAKNQQTGGLAYNIYGLKDNNGQPTQVNGRQAAQFANVTGGVIIALGKGGDKVVVEQIEDYAFDFNPEVGYLVEPTTFHHLDIDVGPGNDRVELNNVAVIGELDIAGRGDHIIHVTSNKPTSGRDWFTGAWLSEEAVARVDDIYTYAANVQIATERGDDEVSIDDLVSLNDVTVQTFEVDSLEGRDSVILTEVFAYGTVAVITGSSASSDFTSQDDIFLTSVEAQTINVTTGSGHDNEIGVYQSQAGAIFVTTGRGDDNVVLFQVTADLLWARLGQGDDEVWLTNSAIGLAILDGSEGDGDQLSLAGNTFVAPPRIVRFEAVDPQN